MVEEGRVWLRKAIHVVMNLGRGREASATPAKPV